MPRIVSTPIFAQYQMFWYDFSISQLGASQTGVALKMNVNAATSGALNVTGVPAQFDGSIVGVSLSMTANKTAGVLTITPTVGGTAITTPSSLVAVAVANATKSVVANCDADLAPFSAGNLLGVKITSDGSYTPTTNDVEVMLYVIYKGVTP